jgi:hypothetical protein
MHTVRPFKFLQCTRLPESSTPIAFSVHAHLTQAHVTQTHTHTHAHTHTETCRQTQPQPHALRTLCCRGTPQEHALHAQLLLGSPFLPRPAHFKTLAPCQTDTSIRRSENWCSASSSTTYLSHHLYQKRLLFSLRPGGWWPRLSLKTLTWPPPNTPIKTMGCGPRETKCVLASMKIAAV